MREIFDRHAERLTHLERQAIWQRLLEPPALESRARSRWPIRSMAATAAAAAVAVFVMVAQQREPAIPPQLAPERLARPTPMVQRPVPDVDRSRPHAGRRGTQARIALPTPEALDAGAAIVPDSKELRSIQEAPSRPRTAGTGALSGRITDSHGQPVPYANVLALGTRVGTQSGEDGAYRIDHLPPATYSVQVQALGHPKEIREGIRIEGDQTATVDFRISEGIVVKTLQEISVTAEKRVDTKSSATTNSISAEKLKSLPVDNLREAVKTKAGAVSRGADAEYGNALSGPLDGLSIGPAPPPVIPTTGGTRLPNDEAFDSMFFKSYGVNPFIATDEDPLSTFAVDVDAASYTVARRYIDLGYLPPADAVRTEEFVNFFPQGYPRFESEDFGILIDGAPSPFGRGYHLLRIGLKGREILGQDRKPAQLTFVIDVSGSMDREDRLELVKRALRLLVDQLRDDDRIGIVVYGTQGRVLLEPVALGGRVALADDMPPRSDDRGEESSGVWDAGRRHVLDAIEQLHPEGSTNAEHGLQLGYAMARRAYRPQAINRIVLCSDGVANVGRTGPESILAQVRTDADRGIHLTTIGFGMGNYNDVLMEQLADRGDGNHYYVDDIDEARRVFVENLTGTLQTIAKDAKVQVEFDSTRVLRYRLLGFENRDVADRDFRNDKVDAGEIGAGHEVTALYEVKLAPKATRGTLATVRLRYARPEQEGAGTQEVREIEQRFDAAALVRKFEDAAPRLRLDAAVAEFAEILKGSYWAKEGRLSDVLSVARRAARSLRDDTTTGFVSLVEKAAALSSRSKPGAQGQKR